MSKFRKTKRPRELAKTVRVTHSENRLHFRRCHVCGGVTEEPGKPVLKCGHCGKSMAPFYFFDDQSVEANSDSASVFLGPKDPGDFKMPIRGLTAYW